MPNRSLQTPIQSSLATNPERQRRSAHISALRMAAVIIALACASAQGADPSVLFPDIPVPQVAPHSPAVPANSNSAQTPRVARQHILVKIDASHPESKFLEHAKGLGLRKLQRLGKSHWYSMAIPSQAQGGVRQVAATTRGLPGVLSAVVDPILRINDTIPPTDPYYKDDDNPGEDCDFINDPACTAEELVDQWGLFQVGAESAWAIETGSPEVIIAVLDSGIDLDHDDLLGNIWSNTAEIAGIDGVDDDGNGWVDDRFGYDFAGNNVGSPEDNPASEDNNPDIFSLAQHQWISAAGAVPFGYRFDGDAAVGDGIDNNLEYYPLTYTIDIGVFHGTAVAGIIGMMANNINPQTSAPEGMVGACWHCSIMAVRMINAEGDALGSDAAQAIYYAVDSGAHIINASWGVAPGGASEAELAPMRDAIEYAVANGVLFIAAAGNGGSSGLYFPASMPDVIAVGSSNWNDVRSDFSTYAQGGEVLDLTAPGELIWTSGVYSAYDAWVANYWLLFPELWYEPNRPGDDVYNGGDGTSFAAPLVSAYAGLILSKNPCASPVEVRNIMRTNAVDIGAPGYDAQTGFGRMRMVVPDLGCGTADTPPSINVTAPSEGQTVSGTVEITASASDDYGVNQVEFFVESESLGMDVDGTNGWSQSWDTTASANGPLLITATATDTTNQTTSDAKSVTVNNAAASTSIHVGNLDGRRVELARKRWRAEVTSTIHDTSELPVEGATVSGFWSNGANGAIECTPTDAAGQCTVSKENLKGNVSKVTFTITGVTTPSNDTYESDSNHDPDTDSYGTSIVVPQTNTAPSVIVESPIDGDSFQAAHDIEFYGSADDQEDGDISASLVWASNIDGDIGTGGVFSTALSEGNHTITVTATDSAGASSTNSIGITVGTPVQISAHISALIPSSTPANRNRWNAHLEVHVVDSPDSKNVEGALVTGVWSDGASGAGDCTTDIAGKCTITKNNIKPNIGRVTFSVEDITGSGIIYNDSANNITSQSIPQ